MMKPSGATGQLRTWSIPRWLAEYHEMLGRDGYQGIGVDLKEA